MAVLTSNQKIASASATLILASIIGHILSLGKEILVANYFGITKAMDAFYAAITVPNLINGVLLTTFSSVFIPMYIQNRRDNKNEADRTASIVINYVSLSIMALALLLYFFAPYIMTYGFNVKDESLYLSVTMLRLLSFSLVLSGLVGILTGILHTFRHFAWTAFSQIFITLISALFLIFFVADLGVLVLVYGLLAGLLIQALCLFVVVWKRDFSYFFDFSIANPILSKALQAAAIYFAALVAYQVNITVDRIMAAFLPAGSLSALGYAGKLVQVPLIIFSGAMATAAFPFFSSQVSENKIEELKSTLSKSLRMAGFIFIPMTIISIILARPVIQIIFQRGAFDSRATNLTSIIFICYAFQMLFYTGFVIVTRIFVALKAMHIVLKVSLFALVLNVLLNMIFIRMIRPAAAGIALATSVVYVADFVLSMVYLRKAIGPLDYRYIMRGYSKILVAAGVMGFVVVAAFSKLSRIMYSFPMINQVAGIVALISLALIVFALVAYLLNIEELFGVGQMMKVKLHRVR